MVSVPAATMTHLMQVISPQMCAWFILPRRGRRILARLGGQILARLGGRP
jgi:hypothetical protein